MKKHYFKTSDEQGIIYLQLRYISSRDNDECYEALIIKKNIRGNVNQFTDNYSQKDFIKLQNVFETLKEEDFNKLQEQEFLQVEGGRTYLYDLYYKEWEDYFKAKKKSLEAVNDLQTEYNWYYYEALESQWDDNNVNIKRENLKKLEESVKNKNNVSLYDIYQEARQTATNDYLRKKA